MDLNFKEVDHRLLTKPIRFLREIKKAVAALDKILKQIKVKLKDQKLGSKQEIDKESNLRVHLVMLKMMKVMMKIRKCKRNLRKMVNKI